MPNDYITLTREGREKIVRELEYLKNEKRREIARALAEARSHGDLSENAEYDAAKEAQAINERKIDELERTLGRARIMDDKDMPKDEALLGARVKVQDLDTSEEFEYTLVAEEESDFAENRISVSSPVGRSLLGLKVGEVAEITAPAGVMKYRIIAISR
jgi:transcription elongation factor GreA